MDWLTFIESPLAANLIPVLIGAGLLGWWAHYRDRRTARREQALKFIEETGELLNAAMSRGFDMLHKQNLSDLQRFSDCVGELSKRRLGTMIKSKALLGSGDFAREYERIMFQLRKFGDVLQSWEHSEDADAALDGVRKAVPAVDHEDLKVGGEATGPAALPRPWGYFETWLWWLWSWSEEFLVKSLESALRGRRRFRFPPNPSLQRASTKAGRNR